MGKLKSEEQKRTASERAKERWSKIPKEERRKMLAKSIAALRSAKRPPQSKEARERLSERNRQWRASLTDEERRERSEKSKKVFQEYWSKVPEWKIVLKKRLATLAMREGVNKAWSKMTKEQRFARNAKAREGLQRYWDGIAAEKRKFSKEHRDRISDSLIKYWRDAPEAVVANRQEQGRKTKQRFWDDMSTTERATFVKKLRKSAKKRLSSMSVTERNRMLECLRIGVDRIKQWWKFEDLITDKQQAARVKNSKKRESRAERVVHTTLKDLEIPFKSHVPFGLFVADAYLPKHAVVIECDGIWAHSSESSINRDKRKDVYFAKKGIRVVRICSDKLVKSKNPSRMILKKLRLNL